jgi:hypothetical protein
MNSDIEITGGYDGFISELNRLTKRDDPEINQVKTLRIHTDCAIVTKKPFVYLRRECLNEGYWNYVKIWRLYQSNGIKQSPSVSGRYKKTISYTDPQILLCELPSTMSFVGAAEFAKAFVRGETVIDGPPVHFTFRGVGCEVVVENSYYKLRKLRARIVRRGKRINWGR